MPKNPSIAAIPWRRGWDSNPRCARAHNGFRDRPDRPLWHLSVTAKLNSASPQEQGRYATRPARGPKLAELMALAKRQAAFPAPEVVQMAIFGWPPNRR